MALAHKFALSATAAGTAEAVTFPIDFVKTRLQLQGELQRGAARRGAMGTVLAALHTEGLMGLYAGAGAAVARHIPYTGTRIVVYEQLRTQYEAVARESKHSGASRQEVPLAAKLLLGLTAGGLGQFAAVPADLVKVRMQADGRLVAGGALAAPRYKGLFDALRCITRDEGGLRALWRGSVPAVQRAALVNLGELAAYDSAKRAIKAQLCLSDGIGVHVLASCCSGFVAALVSTPADVVKTRVMRQDPAAPLYRGTWDCLTKSLRAEGLGGMYKGFWPTWARLAPWQMTFWVTYEQLRKIGNLESF